jgi:hypothetical protein
VKKAKKKIPLLKKNNNNKNSRCGTQAPVIPAFRRLDRKITGLRDSLGFTETLSGGRIVRVT